jgi:hypothetical protein
MGRQKSIRLCKGAALAVEARLGLRYALRKPNLYLGEKTDACCAGAFCANLLL